MVRRVHVKVVLASLVLFFGGQAASPSASESESPRGWLGVYLGRVETTEDGRSGVRIQAVIRDSPAERAGLRAQDLVLTVDGSSIGSSEDLVARVGESGPGSWVRLTVLRAGRERNLSSRLGTRPDRPEGLVLRRGWIGTAAIDLPESLRRHFGAPDESGVMIHLVEPGSPAESAGLEVGDVVYAFGGRPVGSVAQLARWVATAGVGNTAELTLARDGVEITVEALVDEAPTRERRRR